MQPDTTEIKRFLQQDQAKLCGQARTWQLAPLITRRNRNFEIRSKSLTYNMNWKKSVVVISIHQLTNKRPDISLFCCQDVIKPELTRLIKAAMHNHT